MKNRRFLWRHFFWAYAGDKYPKKVIAWEIPVWCMRNKMGIGIGFPWSFAHSWGQYLTNKYFKSHPEYYALVNGKRIPLVKPYMSKQVCTSNLDVIRIFADRIRKGRKTTDDTIVSISPDDGIGFCECDKCKALDHPKLYGSKEGYRGLVLSDRVYTFVNAVAGEVKKTHPHLRLGIFSYNATRPAPRALKKLDNNVVISMTQTNARYRNKGYKQWNRERLEEWKKKCSAFVGRDYFGDYSFICVMHPQTKIIADDLKFMKANNYIGFYSECSTDFATNFLNYYITAKLLWNPNEDIKKIIDDMCRRAYGAATAKMKEFYSLMEYSFSKCTTVGKPGTVGVLYANIPNWYSEETLQKASRLLKEAETAARTNTEKKRIRYNMVGLEYTDKVVSLLRIYRKLCDGGLSIGLRGYTPDFSKKYSREQIVDLLKAAQEKGKEVAAMIEKYKGTSIIQPYPFCRLNKVKRWFKNIDDYWQLYGKNKKNKVVTPLSVEWKFKTDPGNIGVKEAWFKTDFDDSDWKRIRTDENWEKQGYPDYNGYAWYRHNIQLPEKLSGKYSLRFGAVDESCWIYVNGRPAGKYIFDPKKEPDGWKTPHYFDISGAVNTGSNCIVVRVHDAKFAGGIWRPVALIHDTVPDKVKSVIFRKDFEAAASKKFKLHFKDAKVNIDEDKSYEGNKSLHIQVEKPYPSGGGLTFLRIKTEVNKEYMISLAFKSDQVKANAKEKIPRWLKKPRLPNVRLIFLNKQKKVCVPVKKYIWFGKKFKEKTDNWELVRKVFKTPVDAEYLDLTLFFNAQGNYWIDEIVIEEL